MIVIPAIDLRDGCCVRLFQGNFARETVYSDDPVTVARSWRAHGAAWLHVVDLDGARAGHPVQVKVIEAIVNAVPDMLVQVGGGIRSLEAIEQWLERGVARVILGTVAVEQPQLVAEAVQRFGSERIIVAVDSRDGFVATHGWELLQPVPAEAVVQRIAAMGVNRFLVTDVTRDGTMSKPNIVLMTRITELGVKVLASGGVCDYTDLLTLARVQGIEAVIVGRALYEGRFYFTRPENWIILQEKAKGL